MPHRETARSPRLVVEGQPVALESLGLGHVDPARLSASVRRLNRTLRRKLDSEGFSGAIITLNGRTLLIRAIAGRLRLCGVVLDIRPKFMMEETWRRRWSILAALGSRRRPGLIALLDAETSGADTSSSLMDPVAEWFVTLLEAALRDGPLTVYQRHSEARPTVRGRILITRTIQSGPLRAHRPLCSYSRMTNQNSLTHLLRWCCEELARWVRVRVLRRRLLDAAARLPARSDRGLDAIQIAKTKLPPGAVRYREPVDYARGFLRSRLSRLPAERVETGGTASMVNMMHSCFEAFISLLYDRIAARRPGLNHRRQVRRTYLTRLGGGLGAATRGIRPDDEICVDIDSIIVSSDSKYKGRVQHPEATDASTRSRIPAADFAQMFTACRISKCSHGLIVQPLVEDLPTDVARQEIWKSTDAGGGLDLTIGVLRLDLRSLKTERSVDEIGALLEGFLVEMGALPVRADNAEQGLMRST